MKKLFYIALCAAGLFLLGGTQTTQAQKIAFVDMQYILKNLPQYETANEQLSMVSKRWQREVDALNEEARVLQSNYQTEQIFLSEEMKQKREAEILAKEKEALEAKRRYFGKDGELFKKREALLFMISRRRSTTTLSKTVLPTRHSSTCLPKWTFPTRCCNALAPNKHKKHIIN